MRVGAWQFDVVRGDVRGNRAAAERGLEAAAREGVELLLLPEMWPTSFLSSFGSEDPVGSLAPAVEASVEALGAVGERAAELGLAVAGSAFAPGPAGELPYNRFSIQSGGQQVLHYDKTHLFTLTAEHLAFTAGEQPPRSVALEARDGRQVRVSGLVCYDLRFGPVVDAAVADGAELLLVPAQWPTTRSAHFDGLIAGRAVEAQAFVVGCNRTGTESLGRRRDPLDFGGGSLIIGPDGSRCSGKALRDEALVIGELDPEQARDLRRQVRVRDDRRDALYRRWSLGET
ncbi:MAG: nitrilase-related carbon-nitrogen hydrolase [Planctomycetota bacterium]